jgi:hypothetical protein
MSQEQWWCRLAVAQSRSHTHKLIRQRRCAANLQATLVSVELTRVAFQFRFTAFELVWDPV